MSLCMEPASQQALIYNRVSMANVQWLFVQALAEKESDGMAKMIYRKDTGEILGVHIFGLHAADLIHEASNAMATHQRVQVNQPDTSLPDYCTFSRVGVLVYAVHVRLLQRCAFKLAVKYFLYASDQAYYLIVQDIKFNVHSHPTLSEVLDELFKQGHLEKMDRPDAKPAKAQKMPQQARV